MPKSRSCSFAWKCKKKMKCLSLVHPPVLLLYLSVSPCLSENKLFLHCIVSLKLHGCPQPRLVPAQPIPLTVIPAGLKACLVSCSTSETVCVFVSLVPLEIQRFKTRVPEDLLSGELELVFEAIGKVSVSQTSLQEPFEQRFLTGRPWCGCKPRKEFQLIEKNT